MTKRKARIISGIESMDNPNILGQVFDFLRLLRRREEAMKDSEIVGNEKLGKKIFDMIAVMA